MDCPDCAMKATRAVNRLPGVESCRISVSDGSVEVSQDISMGLFHGYHLSSPVWVMTLTLAGSELLEYLLLSPQDLELTPRNSENELLNVPESSMLGWRRVGLRFRRSGYWIPISGKQRIKSSAKYSAQITD